MKATTKRLLVLLAAVMLLASVLGMAALAADTADEPVCYEHGDVNGDGHIDSRDAIRTLFYVLWPSSISVNQDCDFNGDQDVTQKDAIYLLYVSLGMYESKGTIHNYYDPIWTWDTTGTEPTAQVSLKCACGQPHTITDNIAISAGTEVQPTCVAAGSREYTAIVTYNGTEFTNTVTVVLPASGTGHTIVGVPTCESSVKCQNCEYTLPKLDHSYVLLQTEKVEGCKHTKRYQCSACQQEIDGTAESDVYYTHSYTATLSKEATCTQEGEQTLTCTCGDVQTEKIPVNETFHVWDNGVEENGITTYTCACGEKKTVVQMSDSGVSAEALKENEVKLDEAGTSVSLDAATAEQLDADKEVVIKVEEVNKDTVGLDAEKLEQIGEAKIYDFSMLSGNQPVTDFNGKVTVSLPYELQSGDDVNDIDVWYIDDGGNVQSFEGRYNNGFVTFETSHFSYYTVTRMTPAERCARYGHNMVEQNKAATCTEDGYAKKFCLRCGHVEQNKTEPMLGHNYKLDESKSVDATCDAPGVKVEVCERCQKVQSKDLLQLTHDWEKTETVAPTCTAKGYDRYVCRLCKGEKIENEKEAHGHDYQVTENGWTWSGDRSKATVTLVCAHDNTHTKDLTAVVTKEMKDSVCVGGEVAYTATAAFNKVTYTDTFTSTQAGVGHTPGSQWNSDDTQHYYLCAVCGDKMSAANHQWKETVTQAPTCDKSGKATAKCQVCAKEKQVILPATGEHSFVNGVCSVCGYSEGTCSHKKLHKVEIDLSQYGACAGKVILQSCDCGQVTNMSDLRFGCEFDETSEHDEENDYYSYKSVCKICGLVAESTERRVIDRDTCSGRWIVTYRITKGDTVIMDVEDENYSFVHPVMENHDPINLADYGLCARTLTQESCPCGARSYWYLDEGGCHWVYDDAAGYSTCSVCGAVKKESRSSGKDGCTYVETSTVSFFKDGQQVFSYTERYMGEEHAYKTQSVERYGNTCEDGFYVEQVCTDCGKTDGSYYDWCVACVDSQVIDTSGIGSCTDSIQIRICPCGAESEWYFADMGEQDHQWQGGYDEQTGTQYQICINCGFSLHYAETMPDASAKDENCRAYYTINYTYGDDKGHSFTFAVERSRVFHDNEESFRLEGQTCEDGVTVIQTCKDCGYTETWSYDYHEQFPTEELDLTDYGFCCGSVTLHSCACGANSYVNMDTDSCRWEYMEGGENYNQMQCRNCGIIWKEEREEQTSTESCARVYQITHTFSKDGQTLGTIISQDKEYSHKYIYDLELSEGAVDCDGGWYYTATCVDCGYSYEGMDFGCYTRIVARETVPAEGVCGTMEKVTRRCACGKESATGVVSECRYEDVFVEGVGWRFACPTCGTYYIRTNKTVPVEGTACAYKEIVTTTYYTADGQEIVSTNSERTEYRHEWLYTYTLMGQTCADGWMYSATCADCGKTEKCEDVLFGCEANIVEREVAYDNDAICAPVYVYKYRCACGADERYGVEYGCQGTWSERYFTCDTCGLQQTNSFSYRRISGTCREAVTMEYTFLLNGETVATVERNWEQMDHVLVCSYKLLGNTCEDGYMITEHCAYCDYSVTREEVHYNHEFRLIACEDMPQDACGGTILVYACACGQQSRVEWNDSECSMSGRSWTETDENGIVHNFLEWSCSKCDMEQIQEWYYTPGADACHKVLHQDYTWKLGDWEKRFVASGIETIHNYEKLSATLIEGSATCEDGVYVIRRCKDCGQEVNSTYYDHERIEVESIGLGQYGSVCGGHLVLEACVCGAHKGYKFSEDTLCDLDEKETEDWIKDVLNENQYTTQYWENTNTESFIYTCAVTDPACGLKIRMSRYWRNENCTAVQYETWQLGYDPETGTCQREITVATGERHAYHPYEAESVNKTVDGLQVSGTKYTCPDCDSYYTELSYYNSEGRQAKYVREAVNTLSNGDNQRLTETWERVYIDGRQYTSLERDECVRADGSIYWYQNAYTYDFTNGCYRTEVYTDSDNNTNTNVYGDAHQTSYKREQIKYPTCTQYGQYVERWSCDVCGKVTQESVYDQEPYAHEWNWDESKQTNVCGICGLESANGASGDIVMEDLTQDYTDGNYVIGYWNRGEVEFSPYVSLILYDATEGENDELVLSDIDFTYLTVADQGICGLAFSQEATAAAAAAAVQGAGYTGSYAVRISFVPLNSTDTLDYAITFDTLTAE